MITLKAACASLLLTDRLKALYRAEAAHKAGQNEKTLAELHRARRLHLLGERRLKRELENA